MMIKLSTKEKVYAWVHKLVAHKNGKLERCNLVKIFLYFQQNHTFSCLSNAKFQSVYFDTLVQCTKIKAVKITPHS